MSTGRLICLSPTDIERFWSKVSVGADSECWEWRAGLYNSGYGQFHIKSRGHPAHRISWAIAHGPIPKHDSYHGLCVCHTCDNRLCVNPAHLFLGTANDNRQDAVQKKRQARGSKIRSSRFSRKEVLAIRERLETGETIKGISADLDVSLNTIWQIKHRKSWSHV